MFLSWFLPPTITAKRDGMIRYCKQHNQTTEFLILCGHAHGFSLLPFWKKFFLEKVREAVHFFLVSLQDFLFDLRCEDFFW